MHLLSNSPFVLQSPLSVVSDVQEPAQQSLELWTTLKNGRQKLMDK